MKGKIILSILFFSITRIATAQWVDLHTPTTKWDEMDNLSVSPDGKNISVWVHHSDTTTLNDFYYYTVSNDYGRTWHNNAAPRRNPEQMFWDNDVLYVQEPTANDSMKKSTDFGVTFTTMIAHSEIASKIIISPNGKWYRLFQSLWTSPTGMYESSDKGLTWSFTNTSNASSPADDYIVANNGNIVATSGANIIYSPDSGRTWTVATYTGGSWPASTRSTISKMSNGTLIAMDASGIDKSTDNGVTWSSVTPNPAPMNPLGYECSGTNIISQASTGGTTYISTDGGVSFQILTPSWSGILSSGSTMARSLHDIYTSGTYKVFKYTGTTAIAEISSDLSFNTYPNPAISLLNIDIATVSNQTVLNIYNSDGQLIDHLILSHTHTELPVTSYPMGIYEAVITYNGRVLARQRWLKL
jgi:hypothetical protein